MTNFRMSFFFYKRKEFVLIICITICIIFMLLFVQIYFTRKIWQQEKLRRKNEIEELLLIAIEKENAVCTLSNIKEISKVSKLNHEESIVYLFREDKDSVIQLNKIPDWDKVECQIGYELCEMKYWNLQRVEKTFQCFLDKIGLKLFYTLNFRDSSENLIQSCSNELGWESDCMDCREMNYCVPLGFSVRNYLEMSMIFPYTMFWRVMWNEIFTSIILFGIMLCFLIWLVRKYEEQKRIEEQKEDYFPILLHDLRKPLSAMKRKVERIEIVQKEVLNADQQVGTVQLRQLIDNMQQKLTGILTMSVDWLGLRINMQKIDLRHLIDEVIAQFLDFPSVSKQVNIKIDYHTEDYLICADPQHLFMLLSNLLDNSLKYSSVQVNILLSVWKEGKWFNISVKDDGFGVLPHERRKIFKRSYRSEYKRQENCISGFGLGLYYAALVVKAHGWKIRVVSDGVNGSEFIISLQQKNDGKTRL